MALATLGLFIAGLIICLSLGLPLIAALSFGYLLFFLYCLRYGFSAKKIATLTAGGIWSVHKVLMVFFLMLPCEKHCKYTESHIKAQPPL